MKILVFVNSYFQQLLAYSKQIVNIDISKLTCYLIKLKQRIRIILMLRYFYQH